MDILRALCFFGPFIHWEGFFFCVSVLSFTFISVDMVVVEHIGELAVSYAILALHDDQVPITADNISTLTRAAGISVARYWPELFEKAMMGRNIDDMISSVGGTGLVADASSAPTSAASAGGDAGEEEKEQQVEKSESDEVGV